MRRRTALRWGYRLGSGIGYFTDPELGAQRRSEILARLESVGGRTRAAPLITWLRELNDGQIGPPPEREADAREAGGSTASSDEDVAQNESRDEGQGGERPSESREPQAAHVETPRDDGEHTGDIEDLTIVEHPHGQ